MTVYCKCSVIVKAPCHIASAIAACLFCTAICFVGSKCLRVGFRFALLTALLSQSFACFRLALRFGDRLLGLARASARYKKYRYQQQRKNRNQYLFHLYLHTAKANVYISLEIALIYRACISIQLLQFIHHLL